MLILFDMRELARELDASAKLRQARAQYPFRQSERLGLGSTDQPTDADTKAAEQAWIEHARGSIEDPELSMWIIQTTIHALVHQAARERPQDLDRELFVEEVTRLIARYVKRPPLAQSGSKKSRS